jgi:hypothetical protein
MKKEALGWVFYVLAILLALAASQVNTGFQPRDGEIVGYAVLSGSCLISGTLVILFGSKGKSSQ